jgi:hypothetical protein|tara:strand:+ start:152 stop:385 length:234 start_codon:yes stop_codon:yes gene_type:complete
MVYPPFLKLFLLFANYLLDSYRHSLLYLGRLGDTPLSAAWDLALLEYTNKSVYESRLKLIANNACAALLFGVIFRYD